VTVTPLVRAVDDSGHLTGTTTVPPPGSTTETPPPTDAGGGPATPAEPGPRAALAPRVALGPKRARTSRRGIVRLRVACPAERRQCVIALRLKRRGRTIAARTVTLQGGVRAIAVSGGRTTRKRIRLLAPRGRDASSRKGGNDA
jgi:hypothetical protein